VERIIIYGMKSFRPFLMITSSNWWVCGGSLPGIAGSNLAGSTDLSLVIVVFFQREASATGRSLV
jgi:hypothetical protein